MNNDNFTNGVNNLNNKTTPPTPHINNLNNTSMQTQSNVGNISKPSAINAVNSFGSQTVNPQAQSQVNNMNSISQNGFQNNDNVNPMPQQNVSYTSGSISNKTSDNDEILLKAFIGKNQEKITTKRFNFAGFFFTAFYMAYRKMFLYSIILYLIMMFILNAIKNNIIIIGLYLLVSIVVGLLVNKIYLYYAKKKINKIKFKNSQKNIDELKTICSIKGGTSVGRIFLELFIGFIIAIVMITAGFIGMIGSLFNPNNWDITINGNEINSNDTNNNDTNNSVSREDATLVEDVIVSGYFCLGSQCTFDIEKDDNYEEYVVTADNADLFKLLEGYSDYVKVNIYYTQKDDKKTIVDYEIFSRSNNENITNVKNADELRTKLGMYSIGIHTESLTLIAFGLSGIKFENDKSYRSQSYIFLDSKNNKYEMDYLFPEESKGLNLVKGNKYNVTFEVVEDTFGDKFYIKSVN